MFDARIEKMAEVLIHYSLEMKPGEKVMIRTTTLGEPLALAVYRQALRAGAYPHVCLSPRGLEEVFYKEASDEQLRFVSPMTEWIVDNFEAFVTIDAEHNTKALSHIDPARIAMHQQARKHLSQRFLQRAAEGSLRWVYTLFPTPAHAQDAEMAFTDYVEFVFNACLPDPHDPIGYWKRKAEEQARLVEWLSRHDEIHVVAPGTDLRLRTRGRVWISADGKENFPDGEVFTAPLEDSVEGHITFTYPAVYMGREVEGVELWFEGGRVVKATAQRGEALLHEMLNTDEGARRVGEFAIGTNDGVQVFTRNTLFDEKIKGTVHLALGLAYPECGGTNESAIHWDMVCDLRDGGRIYADGELFYENGEFLLDGE